MTQLRPIDPSVWLRDSPFVGKLVSCEPARFLAAGGLASFVSWLARIGFSVAFPFPAAVALASVLGMTIGFILYREWVFPGSRLELSLQIPRFVCVNLVGASIVLAVSVSVAQMLQAWDLSTSLAEAQAHAVGIASGALSNYAGHTLLTFANRH